MKNHNHNLATICCIIYVWTVYFVYTKTNRVYKEWPKTKWFYFPLKQILLAASWKHQYLMTREWESIIVYIEHLIILSVGIQIFHTVSITDLITESAETPEYEMLPPLFLTFVLQTMKLWLQTMKLCPRPTCGCPNSSLGCKSRAGWW